MTAVNASQLIQMLTSMIPARLPLLITSAPGCGKTSIVGQVCAALGIDLIVSHPGVEDSTEAKGLPFVVDGAAVFLPFGPLQRARSAKKLTAWFADDLGQAMPSTQAAYMPLIDSTRGHNPLLGDGAEHIVFIAATNRRTDRAGVSGVLEPVKSRFAAIVEYQPEIDEFSQYAIDNDWDPEDIAFLRFKPDLLCAFEASADLTNSPVPRTWDQARKIFKLGLPANVEASLIAGAVGEGAAVERLAFRRLFRELPSIDRILLNPKSEPIPTSPAVLYALSTAIAHRTTPQNFAQVATYLTRMVDDAHGEFAVLSLKDILRRDKSVQQTHAFVKLATGELGKLINGLTE